MIRSLSLRRMRALARTPALQAARLGVLLICGNPALMDGIYPVPAALSAAALCCGWHPALVLTGAAGGCLLSGWSDDSLATFLGCVMLTGASLIPGVRPRRVQAGRREGAACLLGFFGAAARLMTLLSDGSLAGLVRGVIGALVAALLAPTLISALSIDKRRTRLMPDEQFSLMLLCSMAVAGLSSLPLAGGWLGGGAAALFALLGAYGSASGGALFGVCAGLSLAATGGELGYAAALGLCGALAGAVRGLGRWAMGMALLAGSLLGALYGGLAESLQGLLLPALTGALVFWLLPLSWTEAVRELARPRPVCLDADQLAARLRESAARQAARLSHAFEGLSEGYADCRTHLPSEVAMIRRMREALCEGCAGYENCWKGERTQAGRLLCRMLSEAVTDRPLTAAAQLPPDATRHCRRSTQIDRRLQPVLQQFLEERRRALRQGEMRGILSRQMEQAALLLSRLSAQWEQPACVDQGCAELAQAALERAGLSARQVTALTEEGLEIVALLSDGNISAQQARQAAQVLSDELGLLLLPDLSARAQAVLRFRTSPRYQVSSFSAQQPAREQTVCGDSCRVSELSQGRVLLALCDGMGNGPSAQAQSGRALDLLERFLCAGVDLEVALGSLNQLLLAHGEECFTTLDLCVLDRKLGTADFCKLGAANSYILRADRVESVPGGHLPMGILDQVSPSRERRTLRPGDRVVMLSDGVADSLKEGQESWLLSRLPHLRALDLSQGAAFLLEQAQKRDGGKPADDMSVLIACLHPAVQKTDKNAKKAASH